MDKKLCSRTPKQYLCQQIRDSGCFRSCDTALNLHHINVKWHRAPLKLRWATVCAWVGGYINPQKGSCLFWSHTNQTQAAFQTYFASLLCLYVIYIWSCSIGLRLDMIFWFCTARIKCCLRRVEGHQKMLLHAPRCRPLQIYQIYTKYIQCFIDLSYFYYYYIT